MESRVGYTAVGVFMIVFLALFAAAVFKFGKFGLNSDMDKYRVYVNESVSGLNVEAPVKYRGIVVGNVAQISIHPQKADEIELVLNIKKGIPIKESSIASLKPQGITGLSFVDIQPGEANSAALVATPKGAPPIIKYQQSFLARFDASFATMADNLQNILKKTDDAMSDENMRSLAKTLKNVESATDKLSKRLDELEGLTKNSQEIPAALKEAVKKASASAESINGVALDIRAAIARGDFNYKSEVAGTLEQSKALLGSLQELSSDADALVKELQKNPSAVIFDSRDIPKGPGEL